MAEDLGNCFKEIEEKELGAVSPVDIITSWVGYG
jgi:hypothetical protein